VFAVLIGFLECRARAGGRNAFTPEANRDFVRIRVRALDLASRHCRLDGHTFDDLALFVVEAAEERSSAK
jgi:hypothetical protein